MGQGNWRVISYLYLYMSLFSAEEKFLGFYGVWDGINCGFE